jgi:hypothetical protein
VALAEVDRLGKKGEIGKGSGKGSVLDIVYSPPSFLRRYKRWFR